MSLVVVEIFTFISAAGGLAIVPRWTDVIREALRRAFRYNGRVLDVTFTGIEESAMAAGTVIQVDGVGGQPPGDRPDDVHAALTERLVPQYESQIEVEATGLAAGPGESDWYYWD